MGTTFVVEHDLAKAAHYSEFCNPLIVQDHHIIFVPNHSCFDTWDTEGPNKRTQLLGKRKVSAPKGVSP